MNNRKLLSVIIPTYNMERYLGKCLDSLVNAKVALPMMEILVVNDGSKDSSSQIAHEYEAKYPDSVRVIDKENGNYGSCVNRGLKEATGKYIKVLDADDWMNSQNLNRYVEKLRDTEADLVITDYSNVFEGKKVRYLRTFSLRPETMHDSSVLTQISLKDLQMHAITYRTEVLTSIGYRQTEGISYTDQEWIFYPMQKVECIIYYPLDVYQYLLGREGQTMNPKIVARQTGQQTQILKKMIVWYQEQKKNDVLSESKKRYFYNRIFMLVSGHYKLALLSIGKRDLSNLKELDVYLKDNAPELHAALEDSRIHQRFPYHYVKPFVKTGKRPCLIIRWLYRLFITMRAAGFVRQ